MSDRFDPNPESGDFLPCLPLAEFLATEAVAVGTPPLPPGTIPAVVFDSFFLPGVILSAEERRDAWVAILGGKRESTILETGVTDVYVFTPIYLRLLYWLVTGKFQGRCRAPRFE